MGISLGIIALNAHIIKVVQNKGAMPLIINSGNIISMNQIIAIFISKPNSPKVIMRKGKVIRFNIGLIKEFIKPKKSPHQTNVHTEFVISTPLTNSFAKNKPITPAIICKIRLNTSTIIMLSNLNLKVNQNSGDVNFFFCLRWYNGIIFKYKESVKETRPPQNCGGRVSSNFL